MKSPQALEWSGDTVQTAEDIHMTRIITGIASALLLLLASPASAVDGQIEINAVSAAAGGISPGDAPGLPITITAPGSYVLTGDLSAGANVYAIDIQTGDVTLDLGGFTLSGTLSGSFGIGIYISPSLRNIEIRNGTVRSFLNYGIFVSSTSELIRVIDVRAFENGATGLLIQGNGSIVRGCTAALNGLYGIRGFPGSIAMDNVVYKNNDLGMVLNDVAYGGNIVYDNNNGNVNPQVSANFSVQTRTNQCGLAACP